MKNKVLFNEYLKYIILNILAQTAYALYTMTDTLFVSYKCGTNSLTALNIAFPMFILISAIGLMLGIGGGIKFALAKGKNDNVMANKTFSNSILLGLIIGIIFLLLGLFLSTPIIKLMGADEVIYPLAHPYLKLMLIFAPCFIINHILQTFVRNDGGPTYSASAMVIGSVSNIILDYIFIYPLDMGISGAMLATGLSPVISMLILSFYFINKKNSFKFKSPTLNYTGSIIKSGITPFIIESSAGIIMMLFNFLILPINGNIGVAAFGVVSCISLAVTAIYNGLSQGIQPLISTYYSKNMYSEVKNILKYSIITSIIISIILYTNLVLFRVNIINIFNMEHNLVLTNLASNGFILYFIVCPFLGFNVVITTYLNSINKTKFATGITLTRSLILLLPLSILLQMTLKLTGVWLAYPITEAIISITIIIFIIYYRLKYINID